jgi:hypothetical protein
LLPLWLLLLLLLLRLRLLSIVPLRQGVVLGIRSSGLARARPHIPWVVILKWTVQCLLGLRTRQLGVEMCVGVEEGFRVGVAVVLSMVRIKAQARVGKRMIPAATIEAIGVPFTHSVTVALVHLDAGQHRKRGVTWVVYNAGVHSPDYCTPDIVKCEEQ